MSAADLATSAGPASAQVPEWKRWLRWFVTTPRVLVSGGFIVLLVIVALLAPILATSDPNLIRADVRFQPPGAAGLLGTDEFGRDMFSRIIFGARLSLLVSITSVIIALVFGIVMGMVAGYFGNPTDIILMRLADAILSFPPILLAIFVVAFLGSSVLNVILVIGLLYIPRFARIAYSSALSVKENDYILAARAIGATAPRILMLGILPNIFAPLLVQVTLAIGTAILLESGLSFLGLGPPPDIPSWGRSIQQSSRFMGQHAWGVIWPAVIISATVLAFNVFGDALRDRLDPRLRT
jgi:ABC-type dipeptide/oligopeptide/nickel transport system permease subunit